MNQIKWVYAQNQNFISCQMNLDLWIFRHLHWKTRQKCWRRTWFFCSVIRRYGRSYFCILVFGSRAIQDSFALREGFVFPLMYSLNFLHLVVIRSLKSHTFTFIKAAETLICKYCNRLTISQCKSISVSDVIGGVTLHKQRPVICHKSTYKLTAHFILLRHGFHWVRASKHVICYRWTLFSITQNVFAINNFVVLLYRYSMIHLSMLVFPLSLGIISFILIPSCNKLYDLCWMEVSNHIQKPS